MEADPENSFLAPETSFRQSVCLPFLLNAQNADGGWGFHPKSESRAEPTCWALQALRESSTAPTEAVARGVQYLRAAQLGDGSWPSTPEERTGCWVTALCCWALQGTPDSAASLMAGLRWVCNDWPQDSTPWRRFLTRFSTRSQVQPINNTYRGWGWTPGTSSWVEPTSFAPVSYTHLDVYKRQLLALRMHSCLLDSPVLVLRVPTRTGFARRQSDLEVLVTRKNQRLRDLLGSPSKACSEKSVAAWTSD